MAKPKKETNAAQQQRLLRNLTDASNRGTEMHMPGQWQRLIAESLTVLLERSYKEAKDE